MKTLIIDSSYLTYKSHFAFSKKQLSVTKSGTKILTSAIFGFVNELINLYNDYNYNQILTVWDTPPYIKKQIYQGYKEKRKNDIPDLIIEKTLIKAILCDLGIPCFMSDGYEGEEIAASLMNILDNQKIDFYTNDEDCYALLNNHRIRLVNTSFDKTIRTSDIKYFTEEDLLAKYNVTPKQFIQMKILMGCKSDSVPGIFRVGEVTASKLVNRYGSAINVVKNIEEIDKENPKLAVNIRKAIENNTLKMSKILTRIEKPSKLFILESKEKNTYVDILEFIEAKTLTSGNKRLMLKVIKKKHSTQIEKTLTRINAKIRKFD